MNNNRNLQHYINHNKCVNLPQKEECDYLRISNFLSEYLTYQEKLLVLKNLGITDLIDELVKSISNKFESYATLKFLDDTYVKKEDLYYPEDEDDYGSWSGSGGSYSSGCGGCAVDDFLSLASLNPVLNRIITAALNNKADIDSTITIDSLADYLVNYLRRLIPGFGIQIEEGTNIISTTLDMNPFLIVEELPAVGVPNKIYLVPDKENPGVYIQYYWTEDRGWIELGRSDVGIMLGDLLTKTEADKRYALKGTTLSRAILKYYVRKSEVYTPDLYGNLSLSGDLDEDFNWDEWLSGEGGGSVNITIDSVLSNISTNPVQNKVITEALKLKLDKLTAGDGISIVNGVISCSFDSSLYKIVDALPLVGETNKIYLVQLAGGSSYKQYIYSDGSWKYQGIKDLGTDFSAYLKRDDASNIYISKSDAARLYLTRDEFDLFRTIGSGYVTKEYVNSLFGAINQSTLDGILELQGLLGTEGSFLDRLTLTLSSKANIEDVYTKSQSDSKYQEKGNYITTSAFEEFLSTYSSNSTYDDFISDTSTNAVLNRKISAELKKRILAAEVQELYVSKTELESTLSTYTRNLKLKTVNNKSLFGEGNIDITVTIDSTITESGLNPVSGRAIYSALSLKLDILVAGTGVSIVDNVISVTADISPFVFVDSLPSVGVPNKLYLLKDGNSFIQYAYEDGLWVNKGTIDFSIDLTQYARKTDLTTLRNWVEDTFVAKEDVYTPEQGDTLSNGILELVIDPQQGGGTGLSGNSNIRYNSTISEGVTTTTSVGNITAGTDIEELDGRFVSEIFDRMFFKETWTDPAYKHTIGMTINPRIVKVGTPIISPEITATWNSNVLPQSLITTSLLIKKPGQASYSQFNQGETYTSPGNYMFTLEYSYPTGSYEITSNYGNTKEIQVLLKSGSIFGFTQATYPWYINNVEQSVLVPINESYTQELLLGGSPSIAVPGALSRCTIQVDLGLGFMEVEWQKTLETRNGVVYSVWTKQDAYLQNVKHKITFNIYTT